MGKTFEQNMNARIAELEEKVRLLEQERDAAISRARILQDALREKEAEVPPESSEQEDAGSARLILESILKNVPDGLSICGLDGRITYCSEEGIKMSGMSREEMSGSTPEKRRLGMTLYKPDGTTPADIDELPLVQVLRTGKPVMNRELLIRHQGGKDIPIRSNAAPIRDREGNLIGAIHLWRDISEQKSTEKALQESHEKFRTFFMTTPVMTTVSTVKEGRMLDVNRAFETVTGFPRDEAIGKTSYELNLWRRRKDRDRFREILLKNTSLKEEEAEITTKSGETRTVLISAETVELAGEKCMIASAQDITTRKQSEYRLHALIKASSDVLYQMSPDWREIRQLNSDNFLAQTTEPNPNWLQEYIVPEDHPDVSATIEKAIRTKSVFELEHRVRRADSSVGWIHSRAVPILDAEGDIVEWFGAASDITERKRAEQALKKAKTAAEEASRAKSEFLANMSHEIRTPMTVFLAAIEHLLMTDRNPDRRRLLGMADSSARRLRALIDDILDFSRIEARKVEIDEEPFHPRECVRQTMEMFTLPAQEKNLELETDVAPGTPETVIGDPDRLGQVLINLISNAIKFTHEGKIRVCVRTRGDLLEFSVADTGIGIPEQKQGLLFESFSQVDSSFTRPYEGSGLGLAISKGLVELMGGRISVQSREGTGSTFVFTIPVKSAEAAPAGSVEDAPEERGEHPVAARILLAEDEPTIRQMISMMLEENQFQVDVAETGRAAVEKWGAESFDLILMDLQMPEMNGIEATRAIRSREAGGTRRTFIIGLTAHARREIAEECLASGMDRVLIKPVQMKDLFSTIESCLST